MQQVMVRYTVRPEQAEHNQQLIQEVYGALHTVAPEGLRYATFVLEDGVSFLHLATIDTASGDNPLTALPAFAAFTNDIASRCVEPPVVIDVRTVGAYRSDVGQPDA